MRPHRYALYRRTSRGVLVTLYTEHRVTHVVTASRQHRIPIDRWCLLHPRVRRRGIQIAEVFEAPAPALVVLDVPSEWATRPMRAAYLAGRNNQGPHLNPYSPTRPELRAAFRAGYRDREAARG